MIVASILVLHLMIGWDNQLLVRTPFKFTSRYYIPRKHKNLHNSAPMAICGYLITSLLILAIISLCLMKSRKKSSSFPTNWPLIGMLPAVLENCHRIHDYATEILTESGGTFEFKGPLFCNMDMLITCDPANIHHVFSKNFRNYPKGHEFKKIFEILGDGIFNADFELWEFHRRTTLSFMSDSKFYGLLEKSVLNKMENGLFPVLDYFSKQGSDFDLQEIFQRFTFDSICKLVLDYDPCSLSVDLPFVACEKAFNVSVEALLHRHVVPESIWKLQKWLKIGKEKRLIQAWKAFDDFLYPKVLSKKGEHNGDYNLLSTFQRALVDKNYSCGDSRDFLRDTALNLMLAGRDTTSTCLTWLFWLIAKNPSAGIKIREEIESKLELNKEKNKFRRFFTVEESRKLVYLHGALCESLRLFPPVALEHKSPIRPDSLPSGNYVNKNGKVIISFYSTGRMESIWGKDCLEFKPERWISERGGIKHEPSFKFPAFNAGPRTCLGKEMAFVQMRMVAAAIIYHYDIQLLKDHPVSPSDSIILQAKHGLKVSLSRRNV